MIDHEVVRREEWNAARQELLVREKEHTRLGDELARERRELPWVRVEKDYRFDTDEGPRALAELFDGRGQLLVYHFMFGPSFSAGCTVCSSIADSIDAAAPHVRARDATFVLSSLAPLERLQAYKRRMGWSLPWVSSAGSDFNFDFGFSRSEDQTREAFLPMLEAGVPEIIDHNARASGTDAVGYLSQSPGLSVFALDGADVYLTYSTTARGVEFVMGYYGILDRTPRGRDEGGEGVPMRPWIRRHDEY
jgi:predicted dithiol-disulfide oxidoreductase (DUF899 family)